MKNFADAATQLGSVLTLIISIIVLWNVTRGVLSLLANIQRRLTVLRSLFISVREEVRDIQNFLKLHHGYHVRGGIHEIQKDLLSEYNNENTGF